MVRADVLIVGAGPTGLVLALWLTRLGVPVRIIDKTSQPGTTSRALAVQARTLELYRQLDLTDGVLELGRKVPGLNLWVRGSRQARIALDDIGAHITPYGPFIFPQDEHERFLIARLEASAVRVEREVELVGFSDSGTAVTASLRGQGEESAEFSFLAGCDGASSLVRQAIGAAFPGGTYQLVFYVADIEAAGPCVDGELHIDLDEADFLIVFPLHDQGRVRLVGTVRGASADHADTLTFDDVRSRAIENMKLDVRKVNWFSTYRVHHRVTDRFRVGRVFLLGDAAHIHSPAGGQGMNTGIGDAINLAWKLKAVLRGEAPDALLDTYQDERRAFALKLVASTDKGFTLATAQGRAADFLRTRIVPLVVPNLFRFEAAREFMFGTVSQITLNYRHSTLSQGRAGEIHGGERLPWAPAEGADNFQTLRHVCWQVHVYGDVGAPLQAWCSGQRVRLFTCAWGPIHEMAGLARDAMYLIRPDSYVALASPTQDIALLERYLTTHGLAPQGDHG